MMMKNGILTTITVVLASLSSEQVSGCTCQAKWNCNQFYDAYWTVLYDISTVTGPWNNLVSLDNSGGTGPASYTVDYKVGYSYSSSTTVQSTWNIGVEGGFKGLAVKAGYSQTVTTLASETWSSSTDKTFSITVPAGKSERFWQREVHFHLQNNKEKCHFQIPNTYGTCVKAVGNTVYFNAFLAGEECNCLVCNYNMPMTDQIFAFQTDCYSSNPDPASRNSFCPIPGVDNVALRGPQSSANTIHLKEPHLTVANSSGTFQTLDEHGRTAFEVLP